MNSLIKKSKLTEDQLEIIEKNAKYIVSKGMGTVAILFIDSMAPLSFVGSQLLHIANPVLTLIPYFKDFDKIAEMMEDKENVDYFLTRVEYYMNLKDKEKENSKK
jgi:hypothetical protein